MENQVTEEPKPMSELDKLWQEYLQACCEAGQLHFAFEQLDSQKHDLQKKLEATERRIKQISQKHRDLHVKTQMNSNPNKDEPSQPILDPKAH